MSRTRRSFPKGFRKGAKRATDSRSHSAVPVGFVRRDQITAQLVEGASGVALDMRDGKSALFEAVGGERLNPNNPRSAFVADHDGGCQYNGTNLNDCQCTAFRAMVAGAIVIGRTGSVAKGRAAAAAALIALRTETGPVEAEVEAEADGA